jgi:hypothetical protein
MTALYLEFVLAGLVPLLTAGALMHRSARRRPVLVRVSRGAPTGAARR